MKKSTVNRLSRPRDRSSDGGDSVRSRSRLMASLSPCDLKDVGPGWNDCPIIENKKEFKRPEPLIARSRSTRRHLGSRRGSNNSQQSQLGQSQTSFASLMAGGTSNNLTSYFPNQQQQALNMTMKTQRKSHRVLSPSLADLKTNSSVHQKQHLFSPKLTKIQSSADIKNCSLFGKQNSLMSALVNQQKLKTVLTRRGRKTRKSSTGLSNTLRSSGLNFERKSIIEDLTTKQQDPPTIR